MRFKPLSVLTWNVWFDFFEQAERYEAILKIAASLKPDVICFQEVTPAFLRVLRSTSNMHEYTSSDDLSGATLLPYGVLTLAKAELNATFRFVPFPSNMYRKLLVAEFLYESSRVMVGNVHLESLNSQPTREMQLTICANTLASADFYVLCGDFNFCSYRNFGNAPLPLENDSLTRILPAAKDLWLELNDPEIDPGITFSGNINPLVTNPSEEMRYDRIIYRAARGGWAADAVCLIGNTPIQCTADPAVTSPSSPTVLRTKKALKGKNMIDLYPSDHFGIFGRFVASPAPAPA